LEEGFIGRLPQFTYGRVAQVQEPPQSRFLQGHSGTAGLGTTAGRGIDVEIQQGLNQRDFILVARLLPGDSRERPNNAQRTTMQVCPAQYEPTLARTR